MPHKRAKKSVRDANTAAQGYDNAPTGNDNLFEPKHVPSASTLTKTTSKTNERKRKRASGKADSSSSSTGPGGKDEYGGMSKTVYRILNAEKIRKEMKEKQQMMMKQEGGESRRPSKSQKTQKGSTSIDNSTLAKDTTAPTNGLKIRPGENLKAFNNRVEQALRPEISAAVKQSKASRKKGKLSRSAQAKEAALAEEAALHKPPPRRTAEGAVKERASDFIGKEKIKLNDVVQAPPTLTFGGGKKSNKDSSKNKQRTKDLPVSMKQKAEMEAEREKAIARYRELKARQLAAKSSTPGLVEED